ncbi:MAG: polysulfide reductase NrfD, partial [Acidimicrobiia bacterium]|nr:polysulfide reductase NrfD [Acidimicrobiia bacterium]
HKCNMCNHRVEIGLLPSCQIVCPTEAIKIGDLDDPASEISRIIARDDVAVRTPEQNTKPKVYYRGADQASLDPTRSAIANDGLIWADRTPAHQSVPVALGRRPVDEQGVVARTTYTTAHAPTWDDKVSGYFVTKAVAGGMMVLAALQVALGNADQQAAVGVVPPMVAGVFLALTAVLLIADLKQPTRFHYLLTRGNSQSWLVRGAYVLLVFAVLTAAWWVAGLADAPVALELLAVPVALAGLAVAGYTAFLFAQCEGRDLWQSPVLLPLLLARAVVAGGAAYALLDLVMDIPDAAAMRWAFLGGVGAVALLTWAETVSHANRHVELAVQDMLHGAQARWFWAGVVLGIVVPAAVLVADRVADWTAAGPAALAGVSAMVGMFLAETAFVRAGQSVPLS